MKYIVEKSLVDFEFWGGAEENARLLTWNQLECVERELEALFPEGLTEVGINDLFRFNFDTICQILGYENEEALIEQTETCEV